MEDRIMPPEQQPLIRNNAEYSPSIVEQGQLDASYRLVRRPYTFHIAAGILLGLAVSIMIWGRIIQNPASIKSSDNANSHIDDSDVVNPEAIFLLMLALSFSLVARVTNSQNTVYR